MPPFYRPPINELPLNNFLSVSLNASIGSTNGFAKNSDYLFFCNNANFITRIDRNDQIKLINLPGTSNTVFGIGFIGSRLYAHKTTVGIYYSDDFGLTWTQNTTPNMLVGTQGGVFFNSGNRLIHYVFSLNQLQSTTDGLNWSVGVGGGNGSGISPQAGAIVQSNFVGNPIYRLGSGSGQLWFSKTLDGGATWTADSRPVGTTNNACQTTRAAMVRENGNFVQGGISTDGANGAVGLIVSESSTTLIPTVFDKGGTANQIIGFVERNGFLYAGTCSGIWKEKNAGTYDFAMCPTGLINNVQSPPNAAITDFNGKIYMFNGNNLLSTLRES